MSKHVFFNAKVYVEKGNYAEALLEEDGIITMVASNEQVLERAGDAIKIDCKGKTIVPGFNDSHQHLMYMGRAMMFPDLAKATCVEDIVDMCRDFVKKNPDTKGFCASGWNEDNFEEGKKRKPTRHDIDKISTDIPIVLSRVCGHSCVVNSYVLNELGFDKDHLTFDGGSVEVDENNEPSGILTEMALHAAVAKVPEVTRDELKKSLKEVMKYAVSKGLTTVQANDIGFVIKDHDECSALIKEVYDEGDGLLRYTGQQLFDNTKDLEAYCTGPYFNESYHNDHFRRGPLKMFKDGSLGARTAMLRNEYLDAPGEKGVEANTDEHMQEMIRVANNHGMQAVMHVIGDDAICRVINMYDNVNKGKKNPNRHSLIHCQITDKEMLSHIKDSEILIAYQPIFIHYDMHILDSRIPKELISTSYAFNTAEKMGIHCSFGTDAPVEDLNPFECIYCAVTRKDLKGYPKEGFYPEEGVDVETAIDAYTIESAYHEFREDVKGRLKEGYYADLVIIDKDIFTCNSMDIKEIKAEMTMVGGRIVYTAGAFSEFKTEEE